MTAAAVGTSDISKLKIYKILSSLKKTANINVKNSLEFTSSCVYRPSTHSTSKTANIKTSLCSDDANAYINIIQLKFQSLYTSED